MNDKAKRDNRKALPKFLLVILCSAVGGGILGAGSVLFAEPGLQLFERLHLFVGMTAHLLQFGWVAVTGGGGLVLWALGKRAFAQADPDGDEPPEKANMLVNWSILVSAGGIIVSCFWFTASIMSPYLERETMLMALIGLVAALTVFTVVQKLCVDLLRRVNPEKRGSVLDTRFKKDWLGSCDEAEKLNIYKSAYKAYSAVTYTCLFAWLVLVVVYVGTEQSMLLPSFLVLLIWLVQTVVYCVESMRLEQGK